MQSVLENWNNYVEVPLASLDLLANKPKRLAVVSAGTALALWTLKPKSVFNKEGQPNRLYWASNLVPLHWTTVSLGVGALSLLFI
jgi:hypothetical protein